MALPADMTATADPDLVTAALRSLRHSALRCRRAHLVLDHRDPVLAEQVPVPVASFR